MKNYFLYLLMILSTSILAQNTTFTRTINNDSTDNASSAFQTSNGDYYILATTNSSGQGKNDFQVTRTNGLGATLWSYTYGTSGDDIGTSMKPTTDGGAIICGYTDGLGSFEEDGFVMKINSSGSMQWSKYIRTDSNERLLDVIQSLTGVYYVTGYVELDTLDKNMLVSRLDATGTVTWTKTYGGDGDDIGYSLVEDQLSRIVIAGSMANDSVNTGSTGDVDISVLALNSGGTLLLSKNFGTTANDVGLEIVTTTNYKYYVGGSTLGGSGISSDGFVFELDTNFNLSNSNWYGSDAGNVMTDLKLESNSEVIVSMSASGGAIPDHAMVFEVTSGGVGFIKYFGGSSSDANNGINVVGTDASGKSIVFSGESFGNTQTEDLYIIKLDDQNETVCGFEFGGFNSGVFSLTSGSFSHSTTNGSNGSATFTRSSITNSDSILCCRLEARTVNDSLTMCEGDVLNIGRQLISGYVYTWTSVSGDSYSSSVANPSVSPTTSTEYKLVVSSADDICVKDSALVYVKVNARNAPDLIRDTFFCVGNSISISAPSGMNYYKWNYKNGVSVSSTLSISETDTVSLFMIDNNSCLFYDTVIVEQKQLPTFSLGNDTTICENLSIALSGPSAMDEYEWNGSVSASNTYTTNISQVHTLKVTDNFGCEYTDNIQILTNPSSPFSLGNDTGFCTGSSVTLYGASALTGYKWNDVASANASLEVSSAGTYWAEANNSFDCPSFDTIVVAELAVPQFSLGNDTGFCDAISYQLTGPSGHQSYKWSDASSSQILNINTEGLYFLEVIGTNDCIFTDSIDVSLYTSPVIYLGNDTTLSSGGSLNLSPGADFVSYDWSTGQTSTSIVVTDSGKYSVTVVDANGCSGSDEIRVTFTASIAYLDGIKYTLYPNPSSGRLFVKSNKNLVNAECKLFDAQGKEVIVKRLASQNDFIDVTELEQGVYRLVLSTEGNELSFSVFVFHK